MQKHSKAPVISMARQKDDLINDYIEPIFFQIENIRDMQVSLGEVKRKFFDEFMKGVVQTKSFAKLTAEEKEEFFDCYLDIGRLFETMDHLFNFKGDTEELISVLKT